MSAVSGGGNYISDGQIMAWLAEQQNRIYGELDDNMDLSNQRGDFLEALSKIKSDLHAANKSKDFKAVDAELQSFMQTYGSDPQFAKLCDGLQGIADKVHSDVQAAAGATAAAQGGQRVTDPAQVNNGGPHNATVAPGTHVAASGHGAQAPWVRPGTVTVGHGSYQVAPQPKPKKEVGYSDDQLKDWDDLIDSKTGLANKNDQLTMIHIQELRSTLDQGSQLASSFISSGDKTSSAIINNIA